MYRHVLWDWNGTLFDDAWLCVQVINGLLRGRGLAEVSAGRYEQVFGFPLEAYCRELGFGLDGEPFAELNDRFNEAYERRRLECGLRCGARRVLADLHALGVEQSLLSAYEGARLAELVTHFGLQALFSAVVGVDNSLGEGKVALGRRRLRELGCTPGEALLVGDTLHDREVADSMGVDCLLLPSGHQARERLAAAGGRVVDGLPEVMEMVAAARDRPSEEEESRCR